MPSSSHLRYFRLTRKKKKQCATQSELSSLCTCECVDKGNGVFQWCRIHDTNIVIGYMLDRMYALVCDAWQWVKVLNINSLGPSSVNDCSAQKMTDEWKTSYQNWIQLNFCSNVQSAIVSAVYQWFHNDTRHTAKHIELL